MARRYYGRNARRTDARGHRPIRTPNLGNTYGSTGYDYLPIDSQEPSDSGSRIAGTIFLSVGLSLSLIFLLLSVVLSNWNCGTILNSCLNGTSTESYKIVGALLVCAILVNVVALAVSFAGCVKSWATAVALVLTWLGGIVAVAAIAYYFNKLDPTYCPALAVTGIIFALVMTIRGTTCLTFGLSLSILFLILSVALPHWSCGTILHSCLNETSAGSYRTVGVLLVCTILVHLVAVAAAIAGCVVEESCATPAARWLTWFGGILAIAAIAFYFNKVDTTYCPVLAVTGIIFALATAIVTPIRCIL